jgi:hypothetical protein
VAGRQIADALRQDLPDFDDVTLGRLALRFAAYVTLADQAKPGFTAADMAIVLSAAAIELTDQPGDAGSLTSLGSSRHFASLVNRRQARNFDVNIKRQRRRSTQARGGGTPWLILVVNSRHAGLRPASWL